VTRKRSPVAFRDAVDVGLTLWPYGVLAAVGGFLRHVGRAGIFRSPKAIAMFLLGWVVLTAAAGGALHAVLAIESEHG
jgi:hypothetical protein